MHKSRPSFKAHALAIALLGWLALVGIMPAGAQTSTVAGLDIVFLIDNAYEQNPPGDVVGDTRNMYEATKAVIGYLRDRIQLQNAPENHTATVIRFSSTAQALLPTTNLSDIPANDASFLNAVATPSTVCTSGTGCYTNFASGFDEAVRQLNANAPEGERKRVFVLLTNSLFGHRGNFTDSEYGNDIAAIGTAVGNGDLYVYGFTNNNAQWTTLSGDGRWRNIRTKVLTNTITSNNLAPTLLRTLRETYQNDFLRPIGTYITNTTLQIPAYLERMRLFFFRTSDSTSITLRYGNTVRDFPLSIVDGGSAVLQVITVDNPPPGEWTIALNGFNRLDETSLELTTENARFEQQVWAGDATTLLTSALTNQPLRIAWRAVGANNTTLNYGTDAYKPTLRATLVGNNNRRYEVSLTDVVNGWYVGDFYSLFDGRYEIEMGASLGNLRYETAGITLTLEPTHLVVLPQVANQYQNWDLTAQFTRIGADNTALTSAFANPPVFTASMTYDGRSVPLTLSDRNSTTGVYTLNAPVDVPYNSNFTLTVTATALDFGGRAPVPLTTRNENGVQEVVVVKDNPTRQFTDPAPRLLDVTRIEFSPRNISAQIFETRYAPTVYAYISESDAGGSVWRLPMTLQGDRYVAQFYPSRDVVHTLRIEATANINSLTTTLVDETASTNLDPRPVSVRLVSPSRVNQFETYTFDFRLFEEGGTPLSRNFTANITMQPELRVNEEVIATLQPVAGEVGRYSATYTFTRSGEYPISVDFNIPQNDNLFGGEPRLLTLPLETVAPITVTATANQMVVEQNREVTASEPILEPLTFALRLSAINDMEQFIQTYGISGGRLFLQVGETQIGPITMPFNSNSGRFEATYIPALPGAYVASAELIGRDGILMTRADFSGESINVRPLTLAARPLGERTSFRQTETIALELTLRDGGTQYTGTPNPAPTVSVSVRLNGQQVASYDTLRFEENTYRQVMGPFAQEGDYTLFITANATDSLGNTSPLAQDESIGNFTFKVEQAQNLVVVALAEDSQFSTPIVPSAERLPLVFRVRLDSIPASAQSLADPQRREAVDPSVVFGNVPEGEWYRVRVLQGEVVIERETYQIDPPINEGGILRYEIRGLPDAPNYSLEVSLNETLTEGMVPYPYSIVRGGQGEIATTTTSLIPVNYQTNPLQTAISIGIIAAVVAVLLFFFVVRRSNNRAAKPTGYLYIADEAGRIFWEYDLNQNANTNTHLIKPAFPRARLDVLEVISNRRLKRNGELIKVRWTMNGVKDNTAHELKFDDEPIGISEGRFKLWRSKHKRTRYSADAEIQDIHDLLSDTTGGASYGA